MGGRLARRARLPFLLFNFIKERVESVLNAFNPYTLAGYGF